MIYITQLIFIKKGKEAAFLEFEEHAIPLMEKYNGRIHYRLRPEKDSFIAADADQPLPYEIHFISFDTENDLNDFMKDDSRLEFIHLKNESIQSTILIKGTALESSK